MIMVAKPTKPFSYTAKGTVRRGAVIKDYEEEIDALYQLVEESTQADIPLPPQWNKGAALEFTRAVVERVVGRQIADDVDMFQRFFYCFHFGWCA